MCDCGTCLKYNLVVPFVLLAHLKSDRLELKEKHVRKVCCFNLWKNATVALGEHTMERTQSFGVVSQV
jgi:hypothetical protein